MTSKTDFRACPWMMLVLLSCPFATSRAADESKAADKAQATGKASAESTEFLRVRQQKDGEPVALETAIARYETPEGKEPKLVVDLIGVVHIGDESYYSKLNKRFTQYDALLYELVAPDEANVPKADDKSRGASLLSGFQRGLKGVLELEFQLDHIDYTQKNFVHADMSPDEFSKTMSKRGESFLQMFFRSLGQGAALQAKDPERYNDATILMAMFAKDRPLRLKRLMAAQFEDMESAMSPFSGPEGSTIITERNKKALEVLDREIKGGKRHIGIFYGAGHMSDMEQRLLTDFGLKLTDVKWLSAWSLQPKKSDK